LEFKIH